MPLKNTKLVSNSLTNLFLVCKTIFAKLGIELTNVHLKRLDVINKLAAIEDVNLSAQSNQVLSVLVNAISKEVDANIEETYIESIYQQVKKADEIESAAQKALYQRDEYDKRPLDKRIEEPRDGQGAFLQLEDHDVTLLMPKSAGNIEVLATFNQADVGSHGILKEALAKACKDPNIKHIMFPMGPGHWRGVYITKPAPGKANEEQGPYVIELYDSIGIKYAQSAVDPLLRFLNPANENAFGLREEELVITHLSPKVKQIDGYTCGDFASAYSNRKMKEWGASSENYRQNMIDVLNMPYIEGASSLLRMVSIFETKDSSKSTNAEPKPQSQKILRDFEQEKAAILALKLPDIKLLSAVKISQELQEQAETIQGILPKEAVNNSEVPKDMSENLSSALNEVSPSEITSSEPVLTSIPEEKLTSNPSSAPADPLSSAPAAVDLPPTPALVVSDEAPVITTPSSNPTSVPEELPSIPKQAPIPNESLLSHKKSYDSLVLELETLAVEYAKSNQTKVAPYPKFIRDTAKELSNKGTVFFESASKNPENISKSFESFSKDCEAICKNAENYFKHDKSAWSKIKPILGGFVGLVVAIAATLLTLGIATCYVASKASRRDRFMDTFFRAEPKALTEAKNRWNDYNLKLRLFGGEQGTKDEKKGILQEIENATPKSLTQP